MDTSNINTVTQNERSYFENLLTLLPQPHDINYQLMDLLKIQISKHSGGNSSASKERAQALMDSMVYVISLYLKQYKLEIALTLLQDKLLKDIYQVALKWMIKIMAGLGNKVQQIQTDKVLVDYTLYNDTLGPGLNAFINHYNYEYNALDAVITFDYPTYNSITHKQGIELFSQYLKYIEIENTLCHQFNQDMIQKMLQNYNHHYQFYVFNMSHLLLKQILLLRILNQDIQEIILSSTQIKAIYQLLNGKTKLEIYTLITNSYYECMHLLNITDEYIIRYFYLGLTSIASEFYHGCLHKGLQRELSYLK